MSVRAWLALTTVVAIGACSSFEATAPLPVPDQPQLSTEIGEEECPQDVPPEDCRDVTPAERAQLLNDVDEGIKWWDPNCAAVGYAMRDYVMWGKVTRHVGGNTWGVTRISQNPYVRVKAISFRDTLFTVGMYLTLRRQTVVHEGFHYFNLHSTPMGGDESSALNFEYYCVNN